MSSSLRSRRMARNHKRMAKPAKLNLVALMDIFTILVLFLIVNNGEVEVLESDKAIALPQSVSEQRPHATVIVKITDTDIQLDGRSVSTIEEAIAQSQVNLPELAQALAFASARAAPLTEKELELGRSIVIMGDQTMPYSLLKRVMTTCAQTDYRDVSLAVESNPPAPGATMAGAGQQFAAAGNAQ